MSESADFDPGPWRGHDFGDAYKTYDSHVGRSYKDSGSSSSGSSDYRPEPFVLSTCSNPLMILCDVTGSMGEWPKVMFSKLPYLETEGKEYLGDDLEICFGAIGDATCDSHPLQVRPFTKGTDLKAKMLELDVEGGGGGQLTESYELAALYAVHNVAIDNAIKPVLIMIGDEKPYPFIDKDQAERWAGVKLQDRPSTKQVFEQLKKKFSVYMIRKPYGSSSGSSDGMSSTDQEIRACWVDLLGADRVVDLSEAGRVVDVIFGILAQETGRVEYFREEIEGRQKPEQVATVYKSLASIHSPSASKRASRSRRGQSIMKLEDKRDPKGGASRPLL